MPPRLFPFPLRVGTDICSIGRIQKIIQPAVSKSPTYKLDKFVNKLLTWPEEKYFKHRFAITKDHDFDVLAVSQFLAGRWAAKEACRKACEHLGADNGFASIMILPVTRPPTPTPDQKNAETTRPRGLILQRDILTPSQAITNGEEFEVNNVEGQFCEVSISHDKDWATAVAIVPALLWERREA